MSFQDEVCTDAPGASSIHLPACGLTWRRGLCGPGPLSLMGMLAKRLLNSLVGSLSLLEKQLKVNAILLVSYIYPLFRPEGRDGP